VDGRSSDDVAALLGAWRLAGRWNVMPQPSFTRVVFPRPMGATASVARDLAD
jgi:hypothetical protein